MTVKKVIAIDSKNRTQKVQMNGQEEYPYLIISSVEKPAPGFSLEYFNLSLDYDSHSVESFGINFRFDEKDNLWFSNLAERKVGKTVVFNSENMLSADKLLVVPSKESKYASSHNIMAVVEISVANNTLAVKDLGCQDVVMQLKRDSVTLLPQKRC
jgi:hypothetical protein